MFCFELCSNSLWFECKFGYDLNDYELDELCRLFMRIMFMMLGSYDTWIQYMGPYDLSVYAYLIRMVLTISIIQL